MKKHQHNPDNCTACTSCVAYCPVSAMTRDFHGPKMAGPTLERFRRSGKDSEALLEYCSNCKNCDITCPSGVPVSTLNMLAKAEYYKNHPHRLRDWLLSHGELMAKLGTPAAALTNFGMSNPLSRLVLRKIGIADKLPLPRYAARTFAKQFKSLLQKSYSDKVVFFPGCFINYNDPQVGMDFVAVMQANRYEVIVPDDMVCCGSPLVVNGYLDEAQGNAQLNILELKRWVDKGYPIITCCTSCGLMLKQEYQELFDIESVAVVAAKLYDASEFLLELHDKGRLNTRFKPLTGNYLYHAPCHLRAQGMGRPSLDLLKLLPGIEVVDADAGCCGISGNYGFKDDKYDIAIAVGDALFKKIKQSEADAVISDCGTCRWQIAHATGVKTYHPVSIMRQAYT
jgi:glycerol-3-phosphate dehydrogenase subunit C